MRPKQLGRKWTPSAEFAESALIFIYGITNIFLEHLGGAGDEWSAQDLEHVSITILFIGGGLVSQIPTGVHDRAMSSLIDINPCLSAACLSSRPSSVTC